MTSALRIPRVSSGNANPPAAVTSVAPADYGAILSAGDLVSFAQADEWGPSVFASVAETLHARNLGIDQRHEGYRVARLCSTCRDVAPCRHNARDNTPFICEDLDGVECEWTVIRNGIGGIALLETEDGERFEVETVAEMCGMLVSDLLSAIEEQKAVA